MKLQSVNKNESDYETLRNEVLKKHKENPNASFFLKDGLAAWTITSSVQQSFIPRTLSDMSISTNIKQLELIHALANIVTHH